MPDKVEVTIEPTAFTIAPGDTTEASATLHNLGQSVDQFTISLDGLDLEWYTLPVSSVALFPNDQDKLRIILHPPKTAEVKGGSYLFRVNVNSQENPEETTTVELTLEIRAIPELELSISPERITGSKGTYKILVHNPSDNAATLRLSASDAQGRLRFSLRPESLKVPGGSRAESSLNVRLEWMALFGGEKDFDFQVTAEMPEAEEPKIINGQLVRVSWYKALPQVRLPRIRIPWLMRPPAITTFRAATDDRREFRLIWAVKQGTGVTLDDEEVESEGERVVNPTEATRYTLVARNRYGSSSQAVEVHPLPIPKAAASERIRVSLSPTELRAQAGAAPTVATLQLQNLGEIVDKFLIEIEGLSEDWYSRSASSIALMPQATDQVQIPFQPPKKKGVKAKAYPFAVTVRSQTTPEDATTVVGQLEVLPLIEFKLAIHPYRVSCRRKGTFRVSLANTGVSDTYFTLDATDLEEGLRFRFKNDRPEVTAWRTIEVPMIARPKRGSKVGEKKRYDITVTATDSEGKAQTMNCELNHNPYIGSWRPILRIIRIIIFLGIVGVVVFFVLQWGGGWKTLTSSPQTWVNQLIRTIEGWFFR